MTRTPEARDGRHAQTGPRRDDARDGGSGTRALHHGATPSAARGKRPRQQAGEDTATAHGGPGTDAPLWEDDAAPTPPDEWS